MMPWHPLLVTVLISAALSSVRFPVAFAKDKLLKFQLVSMGEIDDTQATEAGFRTHWWDFAHFGFNSYKASDGEVLRIFYDDFTSAEEADRFFEWKSAQAFKVLAKNSKRDARAKTTEYHAELVPADNHSVVEVIWVVGVSVHIVRARNLADAQIFEKQYRR
jgi:hypothetical protein